MNTQNEWLTIDSAPKDVPILLCNKHGVVTVGVGIRSKDSEYDWVVFDADLQEHLNEWPTSYFKSKTPYVTHWMPLPNPPAAV